MQDRILMKLLTQNSDWPLEGDAQTLKVVFETKIAGLQLRKHSLIINK